jgi:Spy/CpxP family protein refolding chaperone
MKKKARKILITLSVLAGLPAYAQQHQPLDPAQMIQRRVTFLTDQLGLSSQQQQQATTIFTNAVNDERSSRSQVKAAHESLQAAITKNDSAAIDQAAGSIATLMAQLISAHAKAEAAFYQTLTADQQAKYAKMPHRPLGMPGFYRGGPDGPGGAEGPPQL